MAERGRLRHLSAELSQEACFRIGTIGRLGVEDIRNLVKVVGRFMKELRNSNS